MTARDVMGAPSDPVARHLTAGPTVAGPRTAGRVTDLEVIVDGEVVRDVIVDGEVVRDGHRHGDGPLELFAVADLPAAAACPADASSAGPHAPAPRPAPAPPAGVQAALLASAQWKAESFQLVNWGGFEGRVVFTFSPGATLISGPSGSGKSTLLDAYIALMMPSDTAFNGASNDATTGRTRSVEQRNLLSYLRGKTDTISAGGHEADKVLRGQSTATWGAVGMTFVADSGARFTAFRVYYVPARATRPGDVVMRMFTVDAAVNLAELERLASVGNSERKFKPTLVIETLPGARHHDSYATFSQALFTRLGIGANGDGTKALRLLARIQAGHQIRTVDDLYKEMVLERPASYAAADRAIEHFDDLEAAYLAMVTEQRKADLLGPITGHHERLRDAQAEITALDVLGLTADHNRTPISLWRARTLYRLLDATIAANRAHHGERTRERGAAEATERNVRARLREAEDAHRAAGGGALQRLADAIDEAGRELDARRGRRERLAAESAVLDAPLNTVADVAELHARARAVVAGFEASWQNLVGARDEVKARQWPLSEEIRRLTDERASLAGRTGRVPGWLDAMRQQVAATVGLTREELPFVAELIDVAPDQLRWRTAIETVLAGLARTLVVPLDRLEEFSAAIDPLSLRGRIAFEGVAASPHGPVHADPRRVAGKLTFRESPYSTWLHRQINAGRNAWCVETAAELADGPSDDLRVTLAGQTRRGRRGTHGRSDTTNIIGFSNREAIADIDAKIAVLRQELAGIDISLREVDERQDLARRQRDACAAALRYSWDDIDTATVQKQVTDLQARQQAMLSADDQLAALEAQIRDLGRDLDTAQRHRHALDQTIEGLDLAHMRMVDEQDGVADEMVDLESGGDVVLDEQSEALLSERFAAAAHPQDPDNLDDFDANLRRLRERLRSSVDAAQTQADRAAADLEHIFAQYLTIWPDPNLGTGVGFYREYAEILENIRSTGLHERRAEWRRRLTEWSGQDLVPLSYALDSAVEDIIDRLEPINGILAGLPFGAGQDRLRIRLRRLTQHNVTVFRQELKTLSSAATGGIPEEAMEARFQTLQRFMAQLRRREDTRLTAELMAIQDRDRLLDVRKHVEITAERYGESGEVLSTHSSLGDKSGGESQELVAFIVGAALRFRLGDELRARPRFAPVLLDEGFVKADGEFAGRAVGAWKGLGFQLVVSAPLDKVTALEPHMDAVLLISKNTTTNYSYLSVVRDPHAPAFASPSPCAAASDEDGAVLAGGGCVP